MKQFYAFLLLISIGIVETSNAQALNTGDVVIIGYAADTGLSTSIDEFSWVPLVDLPAGTKLYFTDAGYNTIDADFMGESLNDEILIKYVVPAAGISAGTISTVTEGILPADYSVISGTKFGNDTNFQLTLPNSGDQLTVFQSTDDETIPATFGDTNFTPLFMVTGSSLSFTALSESKADIVPVSNIDNVTNLVPGLTQGVNAVATGTGLLQADESDNARYVGITSGTRDELLFAVSQLVNWTRYDEAFGNDIPVNSTANGWTTNAVASFTVSTLSTPDNEFDSKISIFPNPSKNTVGISNNSGIAVRNIKLFRANGQLLYETGAFQPIINIADLANGLYLLRIELENNVKTVKKIIKI